MCKPINAAKAAANGLFSALLAERGKRVSLVTMRGLGENGPAPENKLAEGLKGIVPEVHAIGNCV